MCVVQNKSFFAARQHADYIYKMDVATRDRLAELMYEVKEKVPDGTFLEFMNILGKKKK